MTKVAEKKKAVLKGDVVKIQFPFCWDTLAAVKSIPGRRFHDTVDGKYWTAPASMDAVEILEQAGFEFDACLLSFRDGNKISVKDVTAVDVPGLKRELFDFQKKGVAFIEAKGGRALIADEMGLGKTIQALAWLALHPEKRPVVVLCPAHLKLNWLQEIQKTLPGKQNVQVVYGTDTSQKLTGDILIINYDILPNKYETYRDSTGKKRHREIGQTGWVDFLIGLSPEVLIFDEAHYIKSNSALRTKATKKLARKVPHVIALTGTPIVNRPMEGFNIVQAVDKAIFPDFWKFAHTYCGAKHTGFGWDFSGATNKAELHQKLTQSIMIRRKKADVLKDLPDKLYSFVPVELENGSEYALAEGDFIRYIQNTKGREAAKKAKQAEHLVKIEGLKQLAVEGKITQAIGWIEDFLDNSNGNGKLVVFAVHKKTIDRLMKKFKEVAVKVDGSVSGDKRDVAVKAFQNNEDVKLFIGNIQAAGTGLTLTAASSVAFLELPWTPGELVQAEDRCHRIGQENAVNIYYLLAEGTIEEKIAGLLDSKREVLNAVLDGEEMVETKLLTDLIKSYEGGE